MKTSDDNPRPFPLPGAKAQYGPDRTFEVRHIDLHLRVDLNAHRLDGVCTLTIAAIDEPVARVRLDAGDLAISAVHDRAGTALGFRHSERGLAIELARPLAPDEREQLAVSYAVVEPRRGLYFIEPSAAEPDRPRHCWTQSQDEDARHWFPCVDHPFQKQTTSTTIVVPLGTFALGNGRLVTRRDDPAAATTTFVYEQTIPHATYLVTLVAGAFSEIEQRASVPTFYYVFGGREGDGERAFGKTPAMIALFDEKIGVTYPFPRYSQIAVSDFVMGGMENTGATTQTDRTLHDERAHLDFSSDPLVSHELAHQWFGDLLTCRDWSQAWLNEGFATFFEAVWREADLGYDEYVYDVFTLAQQYFDEDAQRYRRPIVCNVYTAPIELFDAHLYQKAGAVLHMLRGELGDRRFWRSIERYVRDNAGRGVETIDFIRAIEAATGRNMRRFFDQWIMRGGHPELEVSAEYDERRAELALTIEQKQKIDDANPPYVFDLKVEAGEQLTLRVERQVQTFTLAARARPALVRIDPGAFILAKWEYKLGAEWSIAALRDDANPTARIYAARALAKDDSPAAREALAAALRDERFWGVAAEIAHELGGTRAPWARAALLANSATRHPKARRAVMEALGEFRGDEVVETLVRTAAGDASYFVTAAALTALGKTQDARALDILARAVEMTSWGDTIARGAIAGLAELADEQAVDVALEIAQDVRRSDALRSAALGALARMTWLIEGKHPRIVRALESALDDSQRTVVTAAIAAASATLDRRLAGALQRYADHTFDARLRRLALVAVRSIDEAQRAPLQMSDLRTELESLRADHRRLLDRVDRLDPR